MPWTRIPIAVRYWSKVERGEPDECWRWTGARSSEGYGNIRAGGWEGPNLRAHRVAYELGVGSIPAGMEIDHLCHTASVCAGGNDCPHRSCVNPAHLEPVTPRVNCLRSNNPMAINSRKTSCLRGHLLAGENLLLSCGRRVCRTCRRRTSALHDAKRRRSPSARAS